MSTETGIENIVLDRSVVTIRQQASPNGKADWQRDVDYSEPDAGATVEKSGKTLRVANYHGRIAIQSNEKVSIVGSASTLEGYLTNANVNMQGDHNNINVNFNGSKDEKNNTLLGYVKEFAVLGAFTITGYTALSALGVDPKQYLDWLAIAALGGWGGWKGDAKTMVGAALTGFAVIYGDDVVKGIQSTAMPSLGLKELVQTAEIFGSLYGGKVVRNCFNNLSKSY